MRLDTYKTWFGLAKKGWLFSALALFLALNITATPITANGLSVAASSSTNTSFNANMSPYDTDGNKFIDQQLASALPNNPLYVNDGRFYDVGRNPEPMLGYAGTAEGDWQFRVTHIKFDRSPDVGGGDETGEGLELSQDAKTKLKHIGESRKRGEWVYKWVDDDLPNGRNEPALYGCKENGAVQNIKIMVRIECARGDLDSAHIGAFVTGKNPNKWPGIKIKKVEFQDHEKYVNKVWVSKGELLDPANPAGGHSEYVELDFDGPVPQSINKSLVTWQWHVDKVLPKGGVDEFTAAVVCKNNMKGWEINRSEGVTEITKPDGTVELKFSPHVFYTVLDKPTSPYYASRLGSNDIETPWVSALEFAIVDKVKLAGQSNAEKARMQIAIFCFSEYGLEYDHDIGRSRYSKSGITPSGQRAIVYSLTHFIRKSSNVVACTDQASSVATLIDLTCGTDASVQRLRDFGYIPKSNIVGNGDGGSCNNPFFADSLRIIQPNPNVGVDDTRWQTIQIGGRNFQRRSRFNYHDWVEVGGIVYDATAGPVGKNAPTISKSRTDYRGNVCDVSNNIIVGDKYEENEEVSVNANGGPDITIVVGPPPTYILNSKHADMGKTKSYVVYLD